MWLYFLVFIRLFVCLTFKKIIFKLVTLCLCKEQLAIIMCDDDRVFSIGYQVVTDVTLLYL